MTFCFAVLFALGCGRGTHPSVPPDAQLLSLSEQLLLLVRIEEDTDSIAQLLENLPFSALLEGLSDDRARMTFWINIYNAWYQILAKRQDIDRSEIFSKKYIPVAGTTLSLDDIEHGILRRYRWKYGLGYLPKPFTPKHIRKLSVSEPDCRIHFALNCGAKSCPPISFYTYDTLEEDLEFATVSFLTAETEIDDAARVVYTSSILQWYKGDFGGKKGIIALLSQYLERDLRGYAIHYKAYDWSDDLMNFSEDPFDNKED